MIQANERSDREAVKMTSALKASANSPTSGPTQDKVCGNDLLFRDDLQKQIQLVSAAFALR
jgi:hypothetical protein